MAQTLPSMMEKLLWHTLELFFCFGTLKKYRILRGLLSVMYQQHVKYSPMLGILFALILMSGKPFPQMPIPCSLTPVTLPVSPFLITYVHLQQCILGMVPARSTTE